MSFVLQHAVIHLELDHEPKFFSYLPLSHIAERLLVEMGSIYTGGELYFTESLEKFAKNLFEVQPTVFFAVHRIWKKFQEGILAKLPQSRLNVLLRIPILSAFVRKKIRKQLGLSKATNIFTGASPTPVELIEWFAALGINIQEAYGLTENCIYSTTTVKNHIKPGFAGQRFPNCEVIISENNEILIKHEALMEGYYKDPQLSAEAFSPEGFLKTGDEGYFDEEGFLKITGRLKELFKTSKGKYVAPSPIEMKISGSVLIEWVCVIGSGQPQPMAMILLSAVAKQKPRATLEPELHQLLHTLNASVDASEHLSKFILLSDEWSVENGLLTPSFKIKRILLEKKYESLYDQWYAHSGTLVWVN
jgi:long-chain acyl-CoA synthetase